MIKIFTDGSTRAGKNQRGANNKGGFGIVIMNEDETIIYHAISFQTENTTNNRMELQALYEGLMLADELYKDEKVKIISDSAYCINMVTSWIFNWARNGWRTAAKKPIENLDLVQAIYKLIDQPFYHCSFEKIDGHNEHIGNELADALATNNENKYNKYIEENDLQTEALPKIIINYPM